MDFVFTATALELLGGDPDHPLEPVIGFATATDDSGRVLVPVLVSDIGARYDWNWLDRAKARRIVPGRPSTTQMVHEAHQPRPAGSRLAKMLKNVGRGLTFDEMCKEFEMSTQGLRWQLDNAVDNDLVERRMEKSELVFTAKN